MVGDESEPRGSVQAFAVLWQRKALIAAVVAGATGLAAVSLEVIDPRYTAQALVALNTRTGPSELLVTTKPTVAAPPLATVVVATEMDILQSRALAEQVVDALALDRDPEFNPQLDDHWTARLGRTLGRLFGEEGAKDARTLAADRVQTRLGVKNGADSYAIRIDFQSLDPNKAALIANAFADLYVRSEHEAKFADMHLATDWISKQITVLRADVARSTDETVAFRRKHNLSPVDTHDQGMVAAQQTVAVETELAQVQRDRADAEAALAQARRALARGGSGMMALTFVEDSSYLQEVRKEEAKVLGKIAEMSVGYRSDSPAVAALQTQLGTLRGEIRREVAGQVEMLANKAAQAKAREDVLLARIREINSGSTASDKAMSELEQRQRELQAKNIMLESFLSRYAELTNRADIEMSDARVASRATPPAAPSFPRPFLFLGVAFVGSLGLSSSLALLLERLRSGFRSTRQIREELGLATLGVIPAIPRQAQPVQPGDYLVDQPDSAYAEAVRSAQLALLNVERPPGRAVMVTSSLPGEGKTAVAVSLARSLALAEKKVLLVDADLRRPAVATQLDVYRIPGLTDYLLQQASLEEIVRHDSRSGMDFVASGGRASDPQRLLDGVAVGRAMELWLPHYDLVLIDTPPVMVTFDCALLAAYCGFAAYVVEWDKTPRRAVEAGIEHLKSFDIAVGGVVLTRVDLERQSQNGDYVDFCFRSSEYYGN